MNTTKDFQMVAKTMAELEDVLAEELIELGAKNVEKGNRMVSFTGDDALLYKANLHCRTALSILKPIHTFVANSADEVYEEIKKMNWEDYLALNKTFSIDAVVFSHIFRHSKFVSYRVKDGIVDYFSEKYKKRPSVSVSNPDLVFNMHIAHNKCTLSLDSSGESLYKRGYRLSQTDAPLNEVLAAGMILKSGWRGESNFIDPMCGSGTLLIEAAMIALNIPPGIHRDSFAFERWNDFDKELFSEVYNDDSNARSFDHKIIGTDISSRAIAIAEKNINNAGLKNYIDLSVKPFQQYREAPQPPGVLMTNPPYGERIKVDDIEELYNMIGERLKHVFTGYEAYVFTSKKENFDNLGLRPSKRFFLFNGPLECEMRKYEIFDGKRDDRKSDDRKREDRPTKRYERDSKLADRDRGRNFKRDNRRRDDAPTKRHRPDSKPTGSEGGRDFKREDRRRDYDSTSRHRPDNRPIGSDRGREFERGSFKDKDRGRDRDRNRVRDSRRDNEPFEPKNIASDEDVIRAVSQKKERFDFKKRSEDDKAPGAERRVTKVFVGRRRGPTKKKDSGEDKNNDKGKDSDKVE